MPRIQQRLLDDDTNPCILETDASRKCMDDNNYNRDMCTAHFLRYKNCRKFWETHLKNPLKQILKTSWFNQQFHAAGTSEAREWYHDTEKKGWNRTSYAYSKRKKKHPGISGKNTILIEQCYWFKMYGGFTVNKVFWKEY